MGFVLVKKPKPRFSWRRAKPEGVFMRHTMFAKVVYVLRYGDRQPGIVFSRNGRQWWFCHEDGRDSRLADEAGLTLAEARKALLAHAKYVMVLKR